MPNVLLLLKFVPYSKNGRSHCSELVLNVQPSGRLEESEVGVGGLHFGWIFLDLLQLVSNLNTVLYQASICVKNSQQLTKPAVLCQI